MKKEELKEKQLYEEANIELVRFNLQDVITTSNAMGEEDWDEWT